MDAPINQPSADNALISRGTEPLNLEMPFSSLRDFVTPNESFYVRCHFPIPKIDPAAWRLKIEGAVATPLELNLEQLQQIPRHTIMATMECAGNGRSFLEPKVKGVEWDLGAVGNGRWSGVLLRDVLQRAGINGSGVEVILEGADKGAIKEAPRPPGEIHYARSLPMRKALDDVLLAFELNSEPLAPSHGFPLRAVVPGWFGMASVKWLDRLIVSREPFNGYYQSIDYTFWERREGLPTLRPLAEMQVKAQIARPAMHEILPAGAPYRVHGAAWGGAAAIARVEMSVDEGGSWNEATLLGEPVANAWRFWEFVWNVPAARSSHTLMARAVDESGGAQPETRVPGYGTYMINQWLPITVEAR